MFYMFILYQKLWYVKKNTEKFGNKLYMEIKFAENLKSLRASKGLTQKELGRLVEVDQRTVSAWEKKICEPSYSVLAKLCEIFDESFDNILT